MEDMRQLVRAGVLKEDFVGGMDAVLGRAPEEFAMRAAHGRIEELQLLTSEELNTPQNRKYPTTKNQRKRKRKRKAQKKGRRAQRA